MSDRDLRNAALFAVQRLWRRHGDAVPFAAIQEGFDYRGERIPFFSTFEGVYKPKELEAGALSVRTTLSSQYEDERISDDHVWYDYSPKPERNQWLRECMAYDLPLLYFLQVKPKPGVEYVIFAPTEVVEDDPARERYLLDLSPSGLYEGEVDLNEAQPVPRHLHTVFERLYGVTETRTRLFQAHFRRQVLDAYDRRCAVCSLGESPVLDGAHMVPDREDLGEPRVSNGLSLCALHHRAFDRDLVGVTPDLTVHVFRDRFQRPDDEAGRVLTDHHGRKLRLPDQEEARPDSDLLEVRWEKAREG